MPRDLTLDPAEGPDDRGHPALPVQRHDRSVRVLSGVAYGAGKQRPEAPVLRTWCARPEEGRGQYDGSLLVAVTGVISGDTPATAVARRDRHRAFAPDAAPGLAQVLNAADEAGSKAVMTVYS